MAPMAERIRQEVRREFPNIGAARQDAVAEELRAALADGYREYLHAPLGVPVRT